MPAPLVTDLVEIQALAEKHHDAFEVMRYLLEMDDDISDTELDKQVDTIAQPIVDAIDCKQCANCCRSLDVYVTKQDSQRMATGMDIALDEIQVRYIDHESAQEVDEWGKFQTSPCVFLKDTLCSIYPHRPESCRTYPVFAPEFRWMLHDLIEGAGICPIIYNVLVRMSEQVEDIIKTASEREYHAT